VIEIALMPIVLFHFHRRDLRRSGQRRRDTAVTFVTMPLIALGAAASTWSGPAPVVVAGGQVARAAAWIAASPPGNRAPCG
jgi:competence protein ComEC